MLRPVVMSGCDLWLKRKNQILMKDIGQYLNKGMSELAKNRELYKTPGLISDIERKMSKCLGNVVRMDQKKDG
jgi:hypothetical protein